MMYLGLEQAEARQASMVSHRMGQRTADPHGEGYGEDTSFKLHCPPPSLLGPASHLPTSGPWFPSLGCEA